MSSNERERILKRHSEQVENILTDLIEAIQTSLEKAQVRLHDERLVDEVVRMEDERFPLTLEEAMGAPRKKERS